MSGFGLGGSSGKRNVHLSAFRGFRDRKVNRHVSILHPAAAVKSVKDEAIETRARNCAWRPRSALPQSQGTVCCFIPDDDGTRS